MKNRHWIALTLLAFAVTGMCIQIKFGEYYLIPLLLLILFTCLPIIIMFRNKALCSLWTAGLTLWGTLNVVKNVGNIFVAISERSMWNTGDILYGYSWSKYIFLEVCSLLASACFLCFGVMSMIWLFKNYKSWPIYIPALIFFASVIIVMVSGGSSISFISIIYNCFEPMILAISAYFLIHGKPEKIQVKEAMDEFSIKEKTGYSYLDEYKQNMKK